MGLSRHVRKQLPEIQRLGRQGDVGDGALLMRAGVPAESLEARKDRDLRDPKRVAFRTAKTTAAQAAKRRKVSLAPVRGMDDPQD